MGTKIDEAMQALQAAVYEERREVADLRGLPRTTGDVEAMLLELAAAATDRDSHGARHPKVRNVAADGFHEVYAFTADPAACQADWSRVLRRYDVACAALVKYARALSIAPLASTSPVVVEEARAAS